MLTWNSDTLWGGDCFEYSSHSQIKYGKGIGVISSNNFGFGFGMDLSGAEKDTTLIGYIKNGVSYGNIYPDWQFTSIENPQNDFFRLSPNPAKTQISLSFSEEKNCTISIWDMQGREMLMLNVDHKFVFNISNWANGLYFVEVRDEKGQVFRQKFVKE